MTNNTNAPTEWVAVPRVATEEMLMAAELSKPRGYSDLYRALIEAAPPAPEAGAQSPLTPIEITTATAGMLPNYYDDARDYDIAIARAIERAHGIGGPAGKAIQQPADLVTEACRLSRAVRARIDAAASVMSLVLSTYATRSKTANDLAHALAGLRALQANDTTKGEDMTRQQIDDLLLYVNLLSQCAVSIARGETVGRHVREDITAIEERLRASAEEEQPSDYPECKGTGMQARRPLCQVCGAHQFKTLSGLTCENGHGGAPSIMKDDEL